MKVEISEGNCLFRFDYSKVYWNSRLQTEHKRLVDSFEKGEVVCDVMAGVGPFAVPAGKKGVFVWANDLNPESYESMKDAVVRNKVCLFSIFCSISVFPLFFMMILYHDGRHSHTLVLMRTATLFSHAVDFHNHQLTIPPRSSTTSTPSAKTATNSSPSQPTTSSPSQRRAKTS